LDTCGPAEPEEEASSSQHHHHPQAKKKKKPKSKAKKKEVKIAQKQEDSSTSSLFKIKEKKEQILQNTCSERCKSLEKTQNATTTTNYKRRWVVYKDQRRFLKVDPRGGGRKEGRKEEE
jgi:hypothetical protein